MISTLSKAARRRYRVIALLSDGRKHTVMEIAFTCRVVDPRSIIRNIRKDGIEVKDEWVDGDETRFKRYWIEKSPYGYGKH